MIIETNYLCAYDSLDYTKPIGAVNDDHSNKKYIDEIESLFNRKFSYLELGCAGGLIIKDLVDKGHDAYGIEGTDHPISIGRHAWTIYHNTRLFTCDLAKPFKILEAPKFDVISNWEFFEHIPTDSILYLLSKIYLHLSDSGIVICGISYSVDEHHLSIFKRDEWESKFFNTLFTTNDYDLSNKLREDYIGDHKSFFVILRKKPGKESIAENIIEDFEKKFT